MRPFTLLPAAAALTALLATALFAADPAAGPEPQPATAPDALATPAATPAPAASPAAPSEEVSAPTGADSQATSPAPAATAPAATAPAVEQPPAAAPAPVETPVAPPQVVTAQIDPELALRLSLLEKTMVAQSESQSAIYSETSRLLMFFGSACVGMGLVAMIAAVFLMHRTLASVSAITVQVAHAQGAQALPSASPAALVPAGAASSPTGFEKVQASGQRFQSRMTSLEQRLEELEHLAGHSTAAPVASDEAAPPTPAQEPVAEPAPRRQVPLSAILVRKSETLMNLGKLNEAMAALDEAAKHEGDPAEIHLARGRVLEKLGRLGDALQSYDLAVTNDQTNTAALLMKAGVLNRQERFEEALTCYERALAVHRAAN